MSRQSALDETRQRRWELRRAHRAATKLAELLEMAHRRSDYREVKQLEDRLLVDLLALDGSADVL